MESTIRVLNEMVEEGILEAYAIGGAMAAVFYVEPVATFDLDVFVLLPAAERDQVSVTLERQNQWLARRGHPRPDGPLERPGTPADVPRRGRARSVAPGGADRPVRAQGKVARMDHLMAPLLAAKARRRRELAALPIEKKLEIVLELQRNVAEIRRSVGRPGPEPWDPSCLRGPSWPSRP